MMIATMKETIRALEQTIQAKDEVIHGMKIDHMREKTQLEVKNIDNNTRIILLQMRLDAANASVEFWKECLNSLSR